jgi:hypothetical protein
MRLTYKNTEGVVKPNINKKAIFTTTKNKKNKKNKKKDSREHRVHANPPPKAHAQKPNGGGYA